MTIRINKNATHIAAIGLALLLFCTVGFGQQVVYNSLPGTNFAGFHTYQWASCGNAHPNGILDAEIKQDIDAVLSEKGFSKVAPESKSDLLVCYQTAVQQQTQWNAFGMGRGFGGGMGQATSSTIDNGTLVFDVYTMADKQQVWQGRMTRTISPSSNEEKNQKNMQKAVAKLLKNFPPPAK